MTENKEIIVLTGKNAVGKSSLIEYLVENGEQKILKLTTREAGENEVDGRDYRFVSQSDFIHDSTMLVITRKGFNLYGINRRSLEEQSGRTFVTLDINGIRQLEKAVSPANIRVMLIEAPKSIVYRRQEKRGEDFDSIRLNRRYDNMVYSNNDIRKIKSPIIRLDGSLDIPDLAKQMYSRLDEYKQKQMMLAQMVGNIHNI